jgi:plasmid stabilization system protein ParE
MSGFVLHPQAINDLEEIWEYIAAESPDAADRVREEIYETIQSLVPFPQCRPQPSGSDDAPAALSGCARLRDRICDRRKAAGRRCGAAWPSQSAGHRGHSARQNLILRILTSVEFVVEVKVPTLAAKRGEKGAPRSLVRVAFVRVRYSVDWKKEKATFISECGLYLMPATTYSPTHFRVQ